MYETTLVSFKSSRTRRKMRTRRRIKKIKRRKKMQRRGERRRREREEARTVPELLALLMMVRIRYGLDIIHEFRMYGLDIMMCG